MFNASYFTYDGVFSGEYGLRIADFDADTINTTDVFSKEVITTKPARLDRFFYSGSRLTNPQRYSFTILSERQISDDARREILSWLLSRSEYKKLVVHQPDLEGYWYNCVFPDINIVYARGRCVGFTVTALFDSMYGYGEPKTFTVSGTGGTRTLSLNNESDVLDGYVYPKVSFRASSPSSGFDIQLINNTDDSSRVFGFSGLSPNESVSVDNELKIITSSVSGDKLSNFTKQWFRLRRGVNKLSVTINGTVTIECPTYVLIGY